ncbi:hemolysin-III protein [Trichoderma chlorosporum]
MSATEVKRRHVHGVSTDAVELLTTRLTAKARTVTWQEVPEWQRDSTYILSGYRPENGSYMETFASLTFLHNETCNVYTHLIGALLLPFFAAGFMRVLSDPKLLNVSGIDYVMFGTFFFGAECCLLLSTLYHLMEPHSHRVERFWHKMDLMGIIIHTVGTFIPGVYYIFHCDPGLQKLHWGIMATSATATAAMISIPKLMTQRWRKLRLGAYVAIGASGFIPLLHGTALYGLEYMLEYSGMKWYTLELALYAIGAVFYGSRFPERLAPGRFDIWGGSHSIFHVFILCAMYLNAFALVQGFTSSRSLDICDIKAGHRARQW